MTIFSTVGIAQDLDPTQAAIKATDQALNLAGRHKVSLAIIAASHDYPVRQVVNGVAGLLSDTPLFGFSTPAQLTESGLNQRSIVVALLVGDQFHALGSSWAESSENNHRSAAEMLASLCNTEADHQAMLVIAEGLNGNTDRFIQSIPDGIFPLGGCLAGGDISGGRTYQIGGSQYNHGGIAAASIYGNIKVGVGAAHGWESIGVYSRISHSKELIIHTLDDRPAAETYSRLFGYNARDWSYPPLNHLVRIYPLGIETGDAGSTDSPSYEVRSPLRVETDGTLRMHSHIPAGKMAYLLVTSFENCIAAARTAAERALEAIGDAEPVLAMIFADIAWKMMLQAQPGSEVQAVSDVLGNRVPIIGGYSFGQIGRSRSGSAELMNQHIQVVLFGRPK